MPRNRARVQGAVVVRTDYTRIPPQFTVCIEASCGCQVEGSGVSFAAAIKDAMDNYLDLQDVVGVIEEPF